MSLKWSFAGDRARVLTVVAAAVAGLAACGGGGKSGSTLGSARDTMAAARPPQSTPRPGASTSSATAANGATRPVVLFVGTSLTAGLGLDPDSAYPMMIQRKIDSAGLPFEVVVKHGVSGETSSGLVDRLDWLTRAKFDVLVLETGANDGLRGIPVATLRANLETAIDRLKAKRPGARLLLVQMEALPNLGPRYAADFHAVYPAVAKEKGITLLPFLLVGVAGHRELNQADGVHPNNVGERMVAATVWQALEPILDSLRAPVA